MEKSNTALRKEIAEAMASLEQMKKRVNEADIEAKAAKATLKMERDMMAMEVEVYKESVGALEGEKKALID